MNTILTAEEFLKSKGLGGYQEFDGVLQEFAKLHVEAQAKEIVEKAEVNMWVGLNKDEEQFEELKNLDSLHLEADAQSILNAYPLTNIK